MKLAAEYLDDAVKFERLARAEKNATLKEQLEKQAAEYRNLAAERAKKLRLQLSPQAALNIT
jgi:hypothetical protein